MKRVLLALTAALASSAVLVGGAGGTHSEGTGPKQELVAGTGTLVVPQPFRQDPMLHVNAQRDETGEARGHFYIRYPETETQTALDFRGEVVCLDVSLNNATIIGEIERRRPALVPPQTGPFAEGHFLEIRITDNGEPGTLDLANFGGEQTTQPSCAVFTAQPGDLPISQGNFIVHMDPPLSLLSALDLQIAEFEAAAGEH
jgi:hypothetical protein